MSATSLLLCFCLNNSSILSGITVGCWAKKGREGRHFTTVTEREIPLSFQYCIEPALVSKAILPSQGPLERSIVVRNEAPLFLSNWWLCYLHVQPSRLSQFAERYIFGVSIFISHILSRLTLLRVGNPSNRRQTR